METQTDKQLKTNSPSQETLGNSLRGVDSDFFFQPSPSLCESDEHKTLSGWGAQGCDI